MAYILDKNMSVHEAHRVCMENGVSMIFSEDKKGAKLIKTNQELVERIEAFKDKKK